DIRIELLLDEILVIESDLLKLQRDIKKRIVLDAENAKNFVAGLLHHTRARVIVLVNAVAEAHQAERIILVLRLLDVFGNAINRADLLKHVERGFVRAAMCRAPEAGNTGRDASERVGARRTGEADGRGRGVLLMVGMKDENAVHRAGENRIDLVLLGRNR